MIGQQLPNSAKHYHDCTIEQLQQHNKFQIKQEKKTTGS
jgi:hypothetical protein